MQKRTIHKQIKLESNFTQIPNHLLQDAGGLSLDARFVLMHLCSHTDDWVVHKSSITKLTEGTRKKLGRDAVNTIYKELVEHGYMHYEVVRDEMGRIAEHRYTYCLEPIFLVEQKHPQTANPSMDIIAPKNPLTDDPIMGEKSADEPYADEPHVAEPLLANPSLNNNKIFKNTNSKKKPINKKIKRDSTSGKPDAPRPASKKLDYDLIADIFNRTATRAASVKKMNATRQRLIEKLFKEYELTYETFEQYLKELNNDPNNNWMFETRLGGDGKVWQPRGFDYLVGEKCYLNHIEKSLQPAVTPQHYSMNTPASNGIDKSSRHYVDPNTEY